jgi:hypothetical protein
VRTADHRAFPNKTEFAKAYDWLLRVAITSQWARENMPEGDEKDEYVEALRSLEEYEKGEDPILLDKSLATNGRRSLRFVG